MCCSLTWRHAFSISISRLTLNPLKWKIWRAPNNASRWQMGFNSTFKGCVWDLMLDVRVESTFQNTTLHYILTADTLIAQTAAGLSETSRHVYQTTHDYLTLQELYGVCCGERRITWRGGTNHCIFLPLVNILRGMVSSVSIVTRPRAARLGVKFLRYRHPFVSHN
jgi:hypothetical protein